jgi:hypothetical protein
MTSLSVSVLAAALVSLAIAKSASDAARVEASLLPVPVPKKS